MNREKNVVDTFVDNMKKFDNQKRFNNLGIARNTRLIENIVQLQLHFWTFVLASLHCYAWRRRQQRFANFFFVLFFVVPFVLSVCCFVSAMITGIICLGYIFSFFPSVRNRVLQDPTTGQTAYPRLRRLSSVISSRKSSVSSQISRDSLIHSSIS